MTDIEISQSKKIIKKILENSTLTNMKTNSYFTEDIIDSIENQIFNNLIIEIYDVYIFIYNNFSEDINLYEFSNKIDENLIREIKETFPVLYNKIETRYNFMAGYINEVICNISQFVKSLEIEKIYNMNIGLGDTHNKGKSTIKFETNVGNFLYKPRNSTIEKNFNELVSEFIEDYRYEIINSSTFSICEEVEYEPYNNFEQTKNFFYNQGLISALLYFFNSSDNHYENIIVKKDKPFYVDLECFDLPFLDEAKINSSMTFINNIDRSIYRTGIFPLAISNSYMNISALTGRKQKVINPHYNLDKFIIDIDSGVTTKSNMKLETSNQKNLIKNFEEIEEPHHYYEELKNGFIFASTEVIKSKKKYTNKYLKMIEDNKNKFRYIHRPTHVYDRVLKLLREPFYRSNISNAVSGIETIKRDIDSDIIFEYEKRALLDGDIPIFYSRNKDLITGEGIVVKNYFTKTLYEIITSNIKNTTRESFMGEVINIQNSLILDSYNSEYKTLSGNISKLNSYPEKNLGKIANHLMRDDYLHISYQNEIASVSTSNSYLYECGGTVLASQYTSGIDELRLYKFLKKSKNNKMHKTDNISITNGISSHLYMVFNLYKLYSKVEYLNEIEKSINDLQKTIQYEDCMDYFSGKSGVLVLLNKIYANIKGQDLYSSFLENNLKKLIIKIAEEFIDYDYSHFGAGFSHGISGIIYALSETEKNFFINQIQETILNLLNLENKYFIKEENNFIDPRTNDVAGFFLCYGLPGILQTRMRLKENYRNDKYIEEKLQILSKDIMNKKVNPFTDISNCHGTSSILELFVDSYNFGYISKDNLCELRDFLVEGVKHNSYPFNNLNSNFGVGVTGWLYTLCRINKKELPSLFFLE